MPKRKLSENQKAERAYRRESEAYADLISKKQAVALRKAAIAFGEHSSDLNDRSDRVGERLNRRLLKAAIAYAEARR